MVSCNPYNNHTIAHSFKLINQFADNALSANTGKTFKIRLANRVVVLEFSTLDLIDPIVPFLRHILCHQDTVPDCRITICDSRSSGIALPHLSWITNDSVNRPVSGEASKKLGAHDGETIYFENKDIYMSYQVVRKHLCMTSSIARRSIFWIPDSDSLHPPDGRPLRSIFQWILNRDQFQIVHCAGVGFEDNGVIITGQSGAGKSTTAVGCINSSLRFAGDENLAISSSEIPIAHSLYNSANLDDNSLRKLQLLKPEYKSAISKQEDKSLVRLYDLFPDKFMRQFPVKAVIVPGHFQENPTDNYNSDNSPLLKISSLQALTALAPTSLFQVPGNKQVSLKRMGQIIRRLPCYRLKAQTPIDEIPDIISNLLSKCT